MCLYPKFIKNPKYKPNKKNKGKPPICKDKRLLYIPAKCGYCYECRKQKQREWRVRLEEQIRTERGYFVTLTISEENIKKLENATKLNWKENPNEIATKALRLFLERCRKETKKSLKHWCVTELGDTNNRIHLHGIFFGENAITQIKKHWKYGYIFIGKYCNSKSINYMTKYMLKVDEKHPDYKQIVLASPGIGNNYFKRLDYLYQKENYKKITTPTYTLKNGTKIAMPKYYKNKIFNDYQKEKMWINTLNKGILYICGEKVKADDWKTIDNVRKYWQDFGKKIMKDNPVYWEKAKTRRAEEKQRKIIAEEKIKAEKFGTKFLKPLQGEISMIKKKEWSEDILNKINENIKHSILQSSEKNT